jgi:hypothetical protein
MPMVSADQASTRMRGADDVDSADNADQVGDEADFMYFSKIGDLVLYLDVAELHCSG